MTRIEKEIIIREMSKEPHTKEEYAEATGTAKSYITAILKKMGIEWTGKYKQEETLCFRCQSKSCTWALHHIPVEGWTAEKTKIPIQGKSCISSYHVIACPNYIASTAAEKAFRGLCDRIDFKLMNNKSDDKFTMLIIGQKQADIITQVMDLEQFAELMGLEIKIIPATEKWKIK